MTPSPNTHRQPPRKRGRPPGTHKPATSGKRPHAGLSLRGSDQAKRLAVGVLEVLAGLRSPAEIARALNVSAMRYYVLEARALQGLVAALEPLPRGRQRKPADEIAALRRQVQRLTGEIDRMRGLVRASQRAVGLPPPPAKPAKAAPGKRRHKPRVRVMVALDALKSSDDDDAPTKPATSVPTKPVTQAPTKSVTSAPSKSVTHASPKPAATASPKPAATAPNRPMPPNALPKPTDTPSR